MAKNCVKCNAVLKDDARFCTKCGAEQPAVKKCPKCGAVLKNDAEFCTYCGTKINADSPVNETVVNTAGVTKSSNKSYGKIGIIIGAVVLVLLIGIGVFSSSDGIGKDVISVKAEDMANDYIRDQAAAEKKYKDKTVKITGTLINKGQFNNTQNYGLCIYSRFAAGKEYRVIVDVDSSKAAAVNKINVGDFVTAEGDCVGIVEQKDPTDISIQVQSKKVNE